jgi:hypothetical protein
VKDPEQLTLDGRAEQLPVPAYRPPEPLPPKADVIPMWLARQKLRGVKPTRQVTYFDAVPPA